jgi:hypothetical protein
MTFRNLLASAAVAAATLAASTAAFAANEGNTSSATGHGTATLIQPIAVTNSGGDLAFGKIVRPTSGTGHVTITNSSAGVSRSASDGAVELTTTAATAPTFTIKGEGNSTYQLEITPLSLSDGTHSIAVTLKPTLDSTALSDVTTATLTTTANAFGGTLGAQQTHTLYIGGVLPVAFDATSATYAGDFTVTATYE